MLQQQAKHATEGARTSEGLAFLMYFGHGDGTQWLNFSDGPVSTSDIEPLATSAHTPFVLDMSCLNGRYELSNKWLGEQWMISGPLGGPRGAIAYVGSSSSIGTMAASEFAVGFTDGMFRTDHRVFGKAFLDGYLTILPSATGTGQETLLVTRARDAMQMLHLFGDPSLSLRPRHTSAGLEFLDFLKNWSG